MHPKHLEIHNFRCFDNFELTVDGESLTIVAPNAVSIAPVTYRASSDASQSTAPPKGQLLKLCLTLAAECTANRGSS